MGKARALKLGIVKGIATVAGAVAKNMPAKCPFCKMKFNVHALLLDEKNTGIPAATVITSHIKNCIMIHAPDKKIRHSCGEQISIGELDDHLKAKHGYVEYNGEMLTAEEFEQKKGETKL